DKKKALEIYNETLGDNIGYAKSIEQAENLYITKTKSYVQASIARAEAEAMINKISENRIKMDALNRGDTEGFTLMEKLGKTVVEVGAFVTQS
ncbi:hypothetical protein ACI3PL_20410, partial [Lacticaseibacillus paracasei]